MKYSKSTSYASGILWGFLGVAAFSLTVPLTRFAVVDGTMSALFIGAGRAVIAGALAAITLWITKQARPNKTQVARLMIVALGVVIGFPLLVSYALETAPASHGAVVIALLPVATAVVVVLRTRERQTLLFWVMASLGAVAAVVFALVQNDGLGTLHFSDLLLFGAVIAAAVGYAEGGLLARELGAWQTVSWALVLSLPVMTVLTIISLSQSLPSGTLPEWAAFAYLSVVSMFLGFFAWYRGLSIGPMAQVSQVQLIQPVMSIGWAALLLGEQITLATIIGGFSVILFALLAIRQRNKTQVMA